jgi:amino acid transporter
MLIAWRDVKVSARLMLWIESVSVAAILIVVLLVLFRRGPHLDIEQVHLHAMTGSGLRLGLVLALFSFVGFESATTLGAEARDPLKTIPRAVIQSALLAGAIWRFTSPGRISEPVRRPCTYSRISAACRPSG